MSERKEQSAVERIAYTLDEAAASLGVSRRTLERKIAAGELPVLRRYGRPLIKASDLLAEGKGPSRRVRR